MPDDTFSGAFQAAHDAAAILVLVSAFQLHQRPVPDADRGCPGGKRNGDGRWRVFFPPGQRPRGGIAVIVDTGDGNHGDFRQGAWGCRTPMAAEIDLSFHRQLFQHGFQGNAVGALYVESTRDFTPTDRRRAVADEIEYGFAARQAGRHLTWGHAPPA